MGLKGVIIGLVIGFPTVSFSKETGKQLFEKHCPVCHSLDLPKSQRLSQGDWDWVMDDMIKKYGLTWLKPGEKEKIVAYLVKNFGIKKKKRRKVY